MLADTVLYLIPYTPSDYLFTVHHLVVIAYVCTTLLLGRGAMSCIVMLCFGECTSIWQNSWYICVTMWGRFKVNNQSPVSRLGCKIVTIRSLKHGRLSCFQPMISAPDYQVPPMMNKKRRKKYHDLTRVLDLMNSFLKGAFASLVSLDVVMCWIYK